MVKIRIGCAGWDYKDWIGVFYPKNLEVSKHLEFYSKYFDFTEINSTFYSLPSKEIIDNWNKRVPEKFRFTVKLWRKITHEAKNDELNYFISQFFTHFTRLEEKIEKYLIQFPPWFIYSEKHLNKLIQIINLLPKEKNYAIELRDSSWFKQNIINRFINRLNIILVTSYIDKIKPYYHPNQSSYYIRLIGNRQLTKFNQIQLSKEKEIEQLYNNIHKLIQKPNIKEIFIVVNNHYTGFAPETVNTLKKKFNISYKSFSTQTYISDFI